MNCLLSYQVGNRDPASAREREGDRRIARWRASDSGRKFSLTRNAARPIRCSLLLFRPPLASVVRASFDSHSQSSDSNYLVSLPRQRTSSIVRADR